MTAVYVDTSVLLVAAGAPSPARDTCVAFLAPVPDRDLHCSVEGMQEFLFHRMRCSDREHALAQTEAVGAALVLHDFTAAVWERSLDLVRRTSVRGRDAVHAASALVAGIPVLATLDQDFAAVPGLEVVQP
ncbi:MAG: VapC toxin family PIN domain ribonuclease [Nocardioides sp.]|nr:VapC toxin family PIN domain ribonuclease [Nocardioides sp.]